MPKNRIPGHLTRILVCLLGILFFQWLSSICCWDGPIRPTLAHAESITFELKEGLNGISLAVIDPDITTVQDLINAIPDCDSVKSWYTSQQKFVDLSNDTVLESGYPYFVHVTADSSLTLSGNPPTDLLFDLITTGQTNINVISLPLDRSHLTTAEELANNIPNCDTIWYWDAEKQGYSGHPIGTEINNFAVIPGYPYFINITANTQWPVFMVFPNANPSRGTAPLTVNFSVPKVYGGIPPYAYSWDLDGDTIEDDNSESPSFLYEEFGTYNVTLTMTDSSDAEATDTITITVWSSPEVTASASPTTGSAPLEVNFSCSATDIDGTIELYEWDFDGDGAYDWSSTENGNTSNEYTAKGSYLATIRVTDNNQLTGTDTVSIMVGESPTAEASVEDETSGSAPFTVDFIGTGSDTDGTIALYEWDFDGDGAYDWSSDSSGNASYTYTSPGVYNATFRVTDNVGLTTKDTVLIIVSGPPRALPRVYPTSGDAPLEVTFFSDGEDLDGSLVDFAWDFDGDGIYDWNMGFSTNTTYTYRKGGTYNATLKVTDNDDLTGTDSITITVSDLNPQGYPTATASATPTNGGAPLRVLFQGQGADPSGTIVSHEWDFDGDGNYDEGLVPAKFIGIKIDIGSNSKPAFIDIDNDGDNDLFIGESYGELYFYRNDGDSSTPIWASLGEVTDSNGDTIDVGSR
ncbi:MAG TPA: PKD domain-containing protein, partial [Desulfobacterales bacterium]|nr:PKD domain-containing protein [Desulfobacterales bacterium]